MTWIDGLIALLVGASVYSAAKSGLLFSALDVGRAILCIVVGALFYALLVNWTKDYVAGAVAFFIAALLAFTLLGLLAKKLFGTPEGKKRLPERVAAGLIGLAFGLFICLFAVPVLGNLQPLVNAVGKSRLAQPFLDAMPVVSSLADAVNVDLPQLSRRPDSFHDEESNTPGRLSRRVNYTRLNGAMCYKCRGEVEFLGYFRTGTARVSPKFRCANCSRTSDGCQTFEGFHEMYGKCPIQVALDDKVDLDCGVWFNNDPVRPSGECPVCGGYGPW